MLHFISTPTISLAPCSGFLCVFLLHFYVEEIFISNLYSKYKLKQKFPSWMSSWVICQRYRNEEENCQGWQRRAKLLILRNRKPHRRLLTIQKMFQDRHWYSFASHATAKPATQFYIRIRNKLIMYTATNWAFCERILKLN